MISMKCVFGNYARTQTEIQADMTSPLQGNEAGLIGYWPMEDGTGSSAATDESNNTFTATLENMDPNTDWIAGAIGLASSGNMVTLTVTDNAGNSATCTATVFVEDPTAAPVTSLLWLFVRTSPSPQMAIVWISQL